MIRIVRLHVIYENKKGCFRLMSICYPSLDYFVSAVCSVIHNKIILNHPLGIVYPQIIHQLRAYVSPATRSYFKLVKALYHIVLGVNPWIIAISKRLVAI